MKSILISIFWNLYLLSSQGSTLIGFPVPGLALSSPDGKPVKSESKMGFTTTLFHKIAANLIHTAMGLHDFHIFFYFLMFRIFFNYLSLKTIQYKICFHFAYLNSKKALIMVILVMVF